MFVLSRREPTLLPLYGLDSSGRAAALRFAAARRAPLSGISAVMDPLSACTLWLAVEKTHGKHRRATHTCLT